MKKILCLDFDGVIHSYSSGWNGPINIPDPPVPGALEFIMRAVRDFEVHIFSSRSNQVGGIPAMQQYLIAEFSNMEEANTFWNIAKFVTETLKWPREKPPAFVGIDDRVLTFNGNWPSIQDLKNFKPWNK
jgi:hypothetical protein